MSESGGYEFGGQDDLAPDRARSPRQLGITLLWAVIGVAVVALIVVVAVSLASPRSASNVEAGPGELTPADAFLTATRRPVVVRGFVFWRFGFGPQLCNGSFPTDPPSCVGPALTIRGFDINRLDLKRGKDGPTDVAWTTETVAFRGILNTAFFDVTEVLS